MVNLESKIIERLLNKRILDIEFYNINESYFVFDPKAIWVIDGGVQIKFEDGFFSYGWDYENGGFDLSLNKSIDKLFGEAPFYSLDAKQIKGVSVLIGLEIEEVNIKWDYYREFNEDGELKDEKIYVPVELIFRLNRGKILHLALINFGIKNNPFEIVNAEYSLDGKLLIALNKEIEISIPNKDL